MPKTYAVPPPPPHNEGKTVAAWTLNLGVVLGAVLVALGMVRGESMFMIVGAGVMALAIVAGVGLSFAGLGQKSTKAEER
ncbi:hypothetical protein M3C58_08720 [Brachybacterium muris]|uniref:Uncharacterized protein n=1 Tax=Brachybacterium muris UCD-AY4 TaxID=1249481 RepID=A0A022KRW8_9MICO|nr:HGxxPAAW family protein [Brachybacterium muris]EYT48473.1 hypothetical protein D641_0111255 [Brachybacterium muris UCD-AY4]MBM7500533.1 hypothetical protein [Brachybacterium muris]MCT1430659.1 hypothetical protein [Brachybacterium muris]MCT1654717.1 hypothetical protein [Brachybacterium muris]MCT1998275.1 hypothetical protein [Brachybacterium muris]